MVLLSKRAVQHKNQERQDRNAQNQQQPANDTADALFNEMHDVRVVFLFGGNQQRF